MNPIDMLGFAVVCMAAGHALAKYKEERKSERTMKILAMHSITCQRILGDYIGRDKVLDTIIKAVDDPKTEITREEIATVISLAKGES